jgi:hypothetical protein
MKKYSPEAPSAPWKLDIIISVSSFRRVILSDSSSVPNIKILIESNMFFCEFEAVEPFQFTTLKDFAFKSKAPFTESLLLETL